MNRILACLDGSPRAAGVLERSRAIAASTGAKLILFRALGLPEDSMVPASEMAMSPIDLLDLRRRHAERDLESMRKSLPEDMVEAVVVRTGAPPAAICSAARELGVDLITLGSHGYEVVDDIVGTTAARVINKADRCVLVVR